MGKLLKSGMKTLIQYLSEDAKTMKTFKKINIFIVQILFAYVHNYPILRPIFPYLGYRLTIVAETSQNAKKKFVLYEGQANNLVSAAGNCLSINYPPVNAYLMNNVVCSSYIDGIIGKDGLYHESNIVKNQDFSLRDSGGAVARKGKFAIVSDNTFLKIKKAILINSIGAFNWYHFFVEALPKLNMVNVQLSFAADWTLLVPDECRMNANFKAAIALFSAGREIIYLKQGQLVQATELLCIDPISKVAFNLGNHLWPTINDHNQNSNALQQYAKVLRQNLSETKNQFPRLNKIFLARRTESSRSYNQLELENIAQQFGFTTIYLDEYCLSDQCALIANSDFIIGPSGAAWTSLLFAQNSKALLTWLPFEYEEFSCFSNLAQLSNSTLNVIFYETNTKIRTTIHASRIGYRIDPDHFRAALENL